MCRSLLRHDGALVEFASAVDAVRCAIDVQRAMIERNAEIPEDRQSNSVSASMSVTSSSKERTSMATASTSQRNSKVLLKPVEFAFRVKHSTRSKASSNLPIGKWVHKI